MAYRKKEFYFCHYPNNYMSDGRMCMGRDWDHNKGGGKPLLQDQFFHSYMTFCSTQLNSDLVTDATWKMYARSGTVEGHPWAITDETYAEAHRPRHIVTARFLPNLAPLLEALGYGEY